MEKTIHKIVTGIKFIYPCIAHGEFSADGQELIITAETKLSSLYPVKLKVEGMTQIDDDYWGRPTFLDENNQYYCELDGSLYYKGNDSEGEPHYPVQKKIEYTYPTIDTDATELNPHIQKVKSYIKDETDFEFLEVLTSRQYSDQPSNNKIICQYRLGVKPKTEV